MVVNATITSSVVSRGNTFIPRPKKYKKNIKIMVVKKYYNAFFPIIEKKLLP